MEYNPRIFFRLKANQHFESAWWEKHPSRRVKEKIKGRTQRPIKNQYMRRNGAGGEACSMISDLQYIHPAGAGNVHVISVASQGARGCLNAKGGFIRAIYVAHHVTNGPKIQTSSQVFEQPNASKFKLVISSFSRRHVTFK